MICIVEDDQVVRNALLWLCESRSLVAQGYSDASSFLRALETKQVSKDEPLCILLDVRMPVISGLELFEMLQSQGIAPPASVCFLTGHGDIPMAVEMLKKGAFDFFEKPFSDNDLIDRLVEGEEHSAAHLSAHASDGGAATLDRSGLASLSKRERQVMDGILLGQRNKVIAADLGISTRTVELHRARIFTKLGVSSAMHLARIFLMAGGDQKS
jgi:two-component system response regulator DctR